MARKSYRMYRGVHIAVPPQYANRFEYCMGYFVNHNYDVRYKTLKAAKQAVDKMLLDDAQKILTVGAA